MPVVVSCPTCRNSLSIDEAQSGRVVTCPSCRHPLTAPVIVPAAPPAAPPEPAPFESGPDEEYKPRKRRNPAARRVPLWVVVAGPIVALAVVAVVAVVYWQGRNAEQERETAELLLVLNRESAILQQESFWLQKDVFAGAPASFRAEREALARDAEQREKALNRKWGYGRDGLGRINNRRAADFDALAEATKAAVGHRLAEAWRSATIELGPAPAAAARPAVHHKWARRAHDQIAEDLKRLETEFRDKGK